MLHRLVEIRLIEKSTAGNPPKIFAGQTAEIFHLSDTIQSSVGGPSTYARHDSTVIWHGGKAKDLQTTTHVTIVESNGNNVLINEWGLNRNFVAPHDVPKGVEFRVLRSDKP